MSKFLWLSYAMCHIMYVCEDAIKQFTWFGLCVLDHMLSWILLVLAHWNNSLWKGLSPHSATLFWFRANQSLSLHLNAACLEKNQQIQFYSLWFDLTDVPTPRSTALPSSLGTTAILNNRLIPFSDINSFLGTRGTRGWDEINMTAAFIVGNGKHTLY